MPPRRRGGGANGAVRGPASALTSFLAGLGVEAPARLSTWHRSVDPNDPSQQPDAGPAGQDEHDVDPAGVVTARVVEAGPTEAGDGTPPLSEIGGKRDAESEGDGAPARKRARGASVDSDDLDDMDWRGDSTAGPSRQSPSTSTVAPQPLKGVGDFMDCGECTKRFTVTAYTKEHPKMPQRWLCFNCCGPLGVDPFAKAKKAVKPKMTKKEERGKIIHYETRKGVAPLGETCIQIIGKYIEDVDQLGDIGSVNLDRVCKIISKSRRLTPETAPLFYSNERKDLKMYDCTGLLPESYITMANLCPNLEILSLDLCGQLSTDAVCHWSKAFTQLRRLDLFGPFLVRKEGWLNLIGALGAQLEGFLITQTPRIDHEIVQKLVEQCPNLTELRLREIGQMDSDMLDLLGSLKKLRRLEISAPGHVLSEDAVVKLLQEAGGELEYLNLSDNPEVGDNVLLAIAENCPKLRQLVFQHAGELTDAGVSAFFEALKKAKRPGLELIDLQKGHDLKGTALEALVSHSKNSVEDLNILGWRDVEHEALQLLTQCRSLKHLNVGWCRQVTDFSLKDVLDACAQIETIRVWGCNQLSDAVPRKKGVKVIGIETHSI